MLFHSTLRRELARSFVATLVVVLTIVLTLFLIRTLGEAALGRASAEDVVLLLGYSALGHVPTMLALSLFIAIVSTLTRMYRDSEMTIWFASGVGLLRFIWPVLQMAWPVLVLIAAMALFVWPWVNTRSQELQSQFERRSDLSRVAPGKFVASGDGQSIFFIERSSADGKSGRHVFMLTRTPSEEVITTAESGRIEWREEDRFLVLKQGQRHARNIETGAATVSSFEQAEVLVNDHVRSSAGQIPPKARASADLWSDSNRFAQGELAWRLGLCLGGVNLMLAGIAVSATQPRRSSNWNLLLALLTFIVYYNLINLSQAWVNAGRHSLVTMMALIHGSAFLAIMGLLLWRSYGTARSLRATVVSLFQRKSMQMSTS
jgi:lipopolysaccharide export system permease protein